MVESSIVFPLTIIISVALIIVMISMFMDFQTERQLINIAKTESGKISNTAIRETTEKTVYLSENKINIFKTGLTPKVVASNKKIYDLIFVTKEISAEEESYIINERELAEKMDLLQKNIK